MGDNRLELVGAVGDVTRGGEPPTELPRLSMIITRQMRIAIPIANAGKFSSEINLLFGERVVDASEAPTYGPTTSQQTHKVYAFPMAESRVAAVIDAVVRAGGVHDTQRRIERESVGGPLSSWANEATDILSVSGLVEYDPLV